MQKMNLLLESSEILPQPGTIEGFPQKTAEEFAELTDEQKETFAELASGEAEKLATIGKRGVQLNMPVIVDRSADEESEAAEAEWIKVYGVLYGKEEEADRLYQQTAGTSAGQAEDSGAADAATAEATGVTDPDLKILNLRLKLEGVPREESSWIKRNGFLYLG